jgi:hypothetical protein
MLERFVVGDQSDPVNRQGGLSPQQVSDFFRPNRHEKPSLTSIG